MSKQPSDPSVGDQLDHVSGRLDRIEAALAAKMNLDLSEFDGQNVKLAREAILAEAAKKAAQVIEDALVEAAGPMTADDRFARIERALGLPN